MMNALHSKFIVGLTNVNKLSDYYHRLHVQYTYYWVFNSKIHAMTNIKLASIWMMIENYLIINATYVNWTELLTSQLFDELENY